jgi:uncharacterized zinc-type alcohol dehydrogenase-like protein
MFVCTGFAAQSATEPLAAYSFNRRDVGKQDVQIEILYCGVCHSVCISLATNGVSPPTPAFPGMRSSAA